MKNIIIFLLILIILPLYFMLSSRRIDGFANITKSRPIQRFTRPTIIAPRKPHPSTNSNGGLVNIS